jgi:pyruvate dehydrogenase E2 component (dihydrolipoamide acetyltransferase)
MSESVVLPALGESVTEGTVTRWLKNVGDTIAVDEPLLEVSTDKVDTEIPSPIAGVLEEIFVQEDETVEVGAILARVGDGSAAAPETAAPDVAVPETAAPGAGSETAPVPAAALVEPSAPVAAPVIPVAASPIIPQSAPIVSDATAAVVSPEPVAATVPVAPSTPIVTPIAAHHAPVFSRAEVQASEGYVTPIVRKLAQESGVDLSMVVGSGVGGRIRKEDVLAAAQAAPSETIVEPSVVVEISPLRGTTVPMSRLRKVIAERSVASLHATAQLTTFVEVDVTRIAQLRQQKKDEFLVNTGSKLSFLPFFAAAAAEALRSNPIVNATVDGDNITYPSTENMSIAVDTERGLLTPVLRDAGDKNIAQIAGEIADLAARTRGNKLTPDELSGGTFTLTNTGSRGAHFDTPLVFLPQVAILGTGAVIKKAAVVSTPEGEAIAVRSMVMLALSYDHRIVDGADAARFLSQMKARLEAGDFAALLGL